MMVIDYVTKVFFNSRSATKSYGVGWGEVPGNGMVDHWRREGGAHVSVTSSFLCCRRR